MHYQNTLLKVIVLSGLLALTTFLPGCGGGSDSDDPINVSITASKTEGIAPLTVSFDVNGVDEADISSIYWDFGDGTGQSSSYLADDHDVSHTYTTAGPFTVTVYVNTWNDGAASSLARVKVFPDVNLVVSSFAIDNKITPCQDDPTDPDIVSEHRRYGTRRYRKHTCRLLSINR